METEGSLLRSKELPTRPNPEWDESNPQLPTLFPKIRSNIILPTTL